MRRYVKFSLNNIITLCLSIQTWQNVRNIRAIYTERIYSYQKFFFSFSLPIENVPSEVRRKFFYLILFPLRAGSISVVVNALALPGSSCPQMIAGGRFMARDYRCGSIPRANPAPASLRTLHAIAVTAAFASNRGASSTIY